MNPIDLSSASDAAHFIVETAGPYVVGRVAEGFFKEIGKETFHSVRAKAETVWRQLRSMFSGNDRLLDTLDKYEANPADGETKAYLEGDLSTYFAHHSADLAQLLPDLRELLALLPKTPQTQYAPQSMTNVKDSKLVQSEGDGTIIIN